MAGGTLVQRSVAAAVVGRAAAAGGGETNIRRFDVISKDKITYELLQLQELEPQAWLTGAWQEPEAQLQLVGDKVTISGALAMKKKWYGVRRIAVAVGRTASLVDEGGSLPQRWSALVEKCTIH